MKVFRHTNGYLYSISQVGWGKTISPPDNWTKFEAIPYRSNRNAPQLPLMEPDRSHRGGSKGSLTRYYLDDPTKFGFTQVFEE